MKSPIALLAAAAALLALPAQATDVGVSIGISQPGVYGRVDIGRFPQPQVVVMQPVIVQQPAYVVARPEPVYLYVPMDHRKNWSKHCRSYNACGAPVYFVQHGWYDQHVMEGRGHKRNGRGNDHGRDDGRGHGKDNDRGHGRDNDRGHGKRGD